MQIDFDSVMETAALAMSASQPIQGAGKTAFRGTRFTETNEWFIISAYFFESLERALIEFNGK